MAYGLSRFSWTDEHTAALEKALSDGMSAGLAAAHLSEQCGAAVTRNAVIGKAARMGFMIAGKQSLPNPTHEKGVRKKRGNTSVLPNIPFSEPKWRPAPVDLTEAPPSLNLSLIDLQRHHCRWSDDPVGPYRFCGAEVSEKDIERRRPYCKFHIALVYVPASKSINLRPGRQANSMRAGVDR